ncbi:hypothetical protein I215_06297 [Galbibacter marinus]|uniref:Uncharacterized protein n=1 Tax=Galbibacter marinus TaxID=555500 RepID=K2P3B3_9FLAO|nr:murein L,D-transpeptidase catalytic domain family protein [Galbibacter marinus]EKF55548.1 hypothetical protein I215_06297 [Galbibacter marinus]
MLIFYVLEKDINDKAQRRGIMMHTASYVKENSGVVGRSHGCPAIDPFENETINNKLKNILFEEIKNGSLLFAYTTKANATDDNGKNYYDSSSLLKCLERQF